MPDIQPREDFFRTANLEEDGYHRLRYLDWGNPDCDRTIVCVHGLTRNAHDFDYIARALCDEYRIFSIDMAGRGKSDYFEDTSRYNYATYMADCMSFIDNFHLRNITWIGTSMGGIIGIMIAAMHQRRIKRLILNDIGAHIPKTALERIVQYVSATPDSFASRKEAEARLFDIYQTFGLQNDDEWQHMFAHSLKENDDGTVSLAYDKHILDPIRAETNNFEDMHDIDLSELWTGVNIPTLILRGAESDILEKETVSAMRSSNLKATSREFEGVGHAPALMNAEQIGCIKTWLTSKSATHPKIPA